MVNQKKGGVTIGVVLLASLIVIGVGLFILFVFTGDISAYFKAGGSSAACTLSLSTGGSAECLINDVIIYDDRVDIKDEDEINYEKFMEKGSRSKDKMAKEALAILLKACLDRGGGPNSKAFSRDKFFGKSEVCLECSSLVIDSSYGKDDGVTSISGLTDYLSKNKPKALSSDKTYMEKLTKDSSHRKAYLAYGSERKLSPSDPSKETITFNSGKDYTIFFLGIKKGKFFATYDKIEAAISADVAEFVFGNSDTYYAFISESKTFTEVCERKVN